MCGRRLSPFILRIVMPVGIAVGLIVLFIVAFIQTRPGWWAAPLALRLFFFFLFVFLLALVLVGSGFFLKLTEQSQARRCLLANRRQHFLLLQSTLRLTPPSSPTSPLHQLVVSASSLSVTPPQNSLGQASQTRKKTRTEQKKSVNPRSSAGRGGSVLPTYLHWGNRLNRCFPGSRKRYVHSYQGSDYDDLFSVQESLEPSTLHSQDWEDPKIALLSPLRQHAQHRSSSGSSGPFATSETLPPSHLTRPSASAVKPLTKSSLFTVTDTTTTTKSGPPPGPGNVKTELVSAEHTQADRESSKDARNEASVREIGMTPTTTALDVCCEETFSLESVEIDIGGGSGSSSSHFGDTSQEGSRGRVSAMGKKRRGATGDKGGEGESTGGFDVQMSSSGSPSSSSLKGLLLEKDIEETPSGEFRHGGRKESCLPLIQLEESNKEASGTRNLYDDERVNRRAEAAAAYSYYRQNESPSFSSSLLSPKSIPKKKDGGCNAEEMMKKKSLGEHEKEHWTGRPWVLITGASSGVGLACTKAQLLRRQRVLAVCRDLEETRRQLAPAFASLRRQLIRKKIFTPLPHPQITHQETPSSVSRTVQNTEQQGRRIIEEKVFVCTEERGDRLNHPLLTSADQFLYREEWRRRVEEDGHLLRQWRGRGSPRRLKTRASSSDEQQARVSFGGDLLPLMMECCIDVSIEWKSEQEGDVLTAALVLQSVSVVNTPRSTSTPRHTVQNEDNRRRREISEDTEKDDSIQQGRQEEIQTAEVQSTKIVILEIHRCDLRDLEDVLKACDRLRRRVNKDGIRALVNNAAIAFCSFSKTKQGIEQQMEVNYIAPFLLTLELLPLLQIGASASLRRSPPDILQQSNDEPKWKGGAVIINVSSRLAFSQGGEEAFKLPDILSRFSSAAGYSRWKAYALSKQLHIRSMNAVSVFRLLGAGGGRILPLATSQSSNL
ncbi:short-chain dehydrogenase [Cystoisospora suis]|uniref:Short-chain dehydrogenase n=1 Tax=Cystoisospora suis TaxID=483139 RepID=A0A2C6KXU6_9APIC|nr:short-chain dehydrogenase [Cystoisospora suis]